MDKTTEGSAPVPPPAEPAVTVTTAEAPAAPASSLQSTQEFEKQVRDAKTPAELRAATERLRNSTKPAVNAAKPQEDTEDGQKPSKAPTEEPEKAAEVEETPEATETEAEPETIAETPEDADDDAEAEGPVTPSSAKKLRVRLPDEDKVGRLAIAYKQRNRDWTMEQAIAAAKDQLGIKPEKETPAPVEAAKPKSGLPDTVDAVDTAIDKLLDERTKAVTELRFEDTDKIDRQVRQLDRHREKLGQEEAKKTQEQVQKQASQYDSAFNESETKAVELYDFAADPKSEGGKRMLEIEADLKANDDPLYHSPSKPLKIAQMVAKELNIAPRRKGAPAPAKAAAPVTPPAAKKQVLPTGGSRTVPPTKPANGDLEEVKSISTMADLRKMQKKLGIGG